MGALVAADLQALTDKLVGRADAAVATPASTMLTTNAEAGLAAYLDIASSDPDLQAALMAVCAAADRQVLTANLWDYLSPKLSDAKWRALASAVSGYVQSAAGAGYASFAAYLSAVGATIHPLAAEIMRAALAEDCFTLSGNVVGAMHPVMDTAAFDRVYTGAAGALVDDTTDAGSATVADVALFASDNYLVCLGSRSKFNRVFLQLSTLASQDAEITVKYWNGSVLASVAGLTDRTTGFSVNGGEITFTMPADWVPTCYDGQGSPAKLDDAHEEELYYLIIQRTGNTLITPPVATWFRLCPEAVTNAAGALVGLAQPPLAIVRITGTNAATITAIQDAQYSRFVPPGAGNSGLKLVALTAIAQDVTFTLAYIDEDGVASTQAQSAWTAPAAGGTKTLALASPDTGVRAITPGAATITTAATSGMFAIVYNAYERAIGAK